MLQGIFKKPGSFDSSAIEELEETLLCADVSMSLISDWVEELERMNVSPDIQRSDVVRNLLLSSFSNCAPFNWPTSPRPYTFLIVGVNGVGKTTTVAKLAWRASQLPATPLLAAADTFRAAGTDQVRIWGERVGCDVVAGQQGADAAAVAFDAVKAAVSRGIDHLIIDTAGRMHTKQPLMNELIKVRRATASGLNREPDETWIVLDASVGRNAIAQAKRFHEMVPLTGVVISKLDGSAKAGFVFSVVKELGLPIYFAGLGEGMEDLVPFNPESFVDALLGIDSSAPS